MTSRASLDKAFRYASLDLTAKIKSKDASEHFTYVCKNMNADPKQTIYIFPGNESHHFNQTLYSLKSGAGLAEVAAQLGDDPNNFPTLSLPTTFNEYATIEDQMSLAKAAIADLWYAMGLGFNFVLPVRKHEDDTYFSNPLLDTEGLEPKFWGGVSSQPNKPLADFYLKELRVFLRCAHANAYQANHREIPSILKSLDPIYQKAYSDGEKKLPLPSNPTKNDFYNMKYGKSTTFDFQLNKYFTPPKSRSRLGWSLLSAILVGAGAVGIAILSGGTAIPFLIGIGAAGFLVGGGGAYFATKNTPAPSTKVSRTRVNQYQPGGSTGLIPTASSSEKTNQAQREHKINPPSKQVDTSALFKSQKLPGISEEGSDATPKSQPPSPKNS